MADHALTRDEATVILQNHETGMRINSATGYLDVRMKHHFTHPLSNAEFTLMEKALGAFSDQERVYNIAGTGAGTLFVTPVDNLDLPVLSEAVNFPGSEHAKTQQASR